MTYPIGTRLRLINPEVWSEFELHMEVGTTVEGNPMYDATSIVFDKKPYSKFTIFDRNLEPVTPLLIIKKRIKCVL